MVERGGFRGNVDINPAVRRALAEVKRSAAGLYLPLTSGTLSAKLTIREDSGNEVLDLGTTTTTKRPHISFDAYNGTSIVRRGYVGYPTLDAGGDISISSDNGYVRTGTVGVKLPSGTSALPSLTFSDDVDTGLYSKTADQIGFVAGGNERMYLTSSNLYMTSATGSAGVRVGLGTASFPSFMFAGDTNTGMYWQSAGVIAWTCDGTKRALLYSGGFRINVSGDATLPAFHFEGDTNTGMYRVTSDQLGFSAGGAQRLLLGSFGATITSTSSSSALKIDTTNNALRPYAEFRAYNGTSIVRRGFVGYPILDSQGDIHVVSDNGYVRIGNTGLKLPDGTAAAPAYTFTNDTDTGIFRSTTNEMTFTAGGVYTLQLRGVTQTHLRGGNFDTTGGEGSKTNIIFNTYDTSAAKGKLAGWTAQTRYSTDHHVTCRVWQPDGDALTYRNFGNTAWVPLKASAFTVSSSRREKARIRTARNERGLLDYAIPGERSLAFSQYQKLRPVLFDDAYMHRDWKWICDIHDDRNECELEKCKNSEAKSYQHVCDDESCPGSNSRPCWNIEQHVDRVGLIAEEVAEIYPKTVARLVGHYDDDSAEHYEKGGVRGIDTHMLHTETINVVQYLIDTVEELQAEVASLKGRPANV